MADIQEEQSRPGDRCILVIFGASGDLTKRKLIPSLYNLGKKNLLPAEFALVGVDEAVEEAKHGTRSIGEGRSAPVPTLEQPQL